MKYKIKGLFLLVCACGAIWLALSFFGRFERIEASAPMVTAQMVQDYQAQVQEEEQKRQNADAARKRAEMQARMYRCQEDDECIIVDKDPCGCLSGPEGVTAINSEWSLEFSRMVEKQFATATTCPSVASVERECSASARPVCQDSRCQIVY